MIAGFRCRVCGAHVDIGRAYSWRCPNASADDRRHVLDIVTTTVPAAGGRVGDNPFVSYRAALAFDAFAAANGMTAAAREALIVETDELVAAVAGTGFARSPFARNDPLSDELGFGPSGGVWVKDETRQVAGSHKARHLFTILLHLRAAELLGLAPARRAPLAISSCGNAAIAAATLAAAVSWPIHVYVPPTAGGPVLDRLAGLGAEVITCPRRVADPPGDPCVHRFREALGAGALPFAVQGPENVWCLDGGRTLGWELADDFSRLGPGISRLFVQVGGGALATSVGMGLSEAGSDVALIAVQTEGCAPLARAWERLGPPYDAEVAARRWAELMWPWESEPHSLADGILDDETYDWLGIIERMARTGGAPVVAGEPAIVAAAEMVQRASGIDAERDRRRRSRRGDRRPPGAGGRRPGRRHPHRRAPELNRGGSLARMSDLLLPSALDTGGDPRSDIFTRLLKNRVIMLGTEVTDEIANNICAQLLYLEGEDSAADIWLYINSPGGSVFAGMAIYDTMQFVSCDVATVCMGMAASMGQFLLTAGAAGKRHTLPNARIMMHQPLAGLRGQAADIAIQAQQLAYTKRRMAELIAHHSGKPLEQIQADSERDRWFTADEAVEYGLVDTVIVRRGQLR